MKKNISKLMLVFVLVLVTLPLASCSASTDWAVEWELFYSKFITYKGYEVALEGLSVTMYIAVVGLLIGIIIGTAIARTMA